MESQKLQPAPYVAPSMRLYKKLGYGVGHVLNDLCGSMWFSYLLVYFTSVHHFSNVTAGQLLLVGQIADAISTPLVGIEADRANGCCRYGRRKSWHLVGSLCVASTFPFIFSICMGCETSDDWAKILYYAIFIAAFQFGWAATQISHLALIPDLTPSENERTSLTSVRYAFTVISNCTVYLVTFLVLNQDCGDPDRKLSREDATNFTIIALTVVGIGSVFTLIFHFTTKELKMEFSDTDELSGPNGQTGYGTRRKERIHMQWWDWFKEPHFYQVGLVYMCTRLVVNISQTYLPIYLTRTLGAQKQEIAVVPLVVYSCGFISSFAAKPMNSFAGRKITFLVGTLFIIGTSVWFILLDADSIYQVYGPAALQGIGTSAILITSLSMTTDLIGDHVESGAFVYGAMGCLDKLSNGAVVMLIQGLDPCVDISILCPNYSRNVLVYVPGVTSLIAMLGVLTFLKERIGHLDIDKVVASDDRQVNTLHRNGREENNKKPLLANADGDKIIRIS